MESLLVANRGEIACRIIRSCRRLGIRAVGVYSDADVDGLHVRLADAAVHIGPAPPLHSYLNIEAILTAARRAGVAAIHPGVGFLAENEEFARACTAAGFVFIGPSAGVIALMADKRAGRAHALGAGVPVLPGYDSDNQADEALKQAALALGFPLLIKAAAGGGGKGMRLVTNVDTWDEALAAARQEAQGAFGAADLLLERALRRPRHVEVQVLGDRHGHLLHLGERDCSLQRRHQKVIEETPAPGLDSAQRQALCAAAVAIARAAGYDNAGTVEFLVDEDHRFYFLEMNTRLQVEHPVTEWVAGLDLVEWQIRIAAGERLPWKQEELQTQGHAIEARLYAEDPANDYRPVTGQVVLWRPPAGEGIRVDSGVESGSEVTVHYDSLLAKIIVCAPNRQTAVERLQQALDQTTLLGLVTNLPFLRAVVGHPAFGAPELHTHFLAEHFGAWRPSIDDVDGADDVGDADDVDGFATALIAATLAQWYSHPQHPTNQGYWRNNPNGPAVYRFRRPTSAEHEEIIAVHLRPLPRAAGQFEMTLSSQANVVHRVQAEKLSAGERAAHQWIVTIDGFRQPLTVASQGQSWWVQTGAEAVLLEAVARFAEPTPAAGGGGSLRAPMPGVVRALLVQVGQAVEAGQPLVKLEAMKMEHTIRAAAAGVVDAIYCIPGEQVEADSLLIALA